MLLVVNLMCIVNSVHCLLLILCVYTPHSVIITIQNSVEVATPPKKRPSNDGNEFTFLSSPKPNTVRFIPLILREDNCPFTLNCDFMKLIRSVAVREPSSVEKTMTELN